MNFNERSLFPPYNRPNIVRVRARFRAGGSLRRWSPVHCFIANALFDLPCKTARVALCARSRRASQAALAGREMQLAAGALSGALSQFQVNISCGVLVVFICIIFVLLMRRRRLLLHV